MTTITAMRMTPRCTALLLAVGLAVATPSAPHAVASPPPPVPAPTTPCAAAVDRPRPAPASPPLIFPPPVTFQLLAPTPYVAPEMGLAPDHYSYFQGFPLTHGIVDVTVTVLRSRASARCWAHQFPVHNGHHPAHALGPDELISDGMYAGRPSYQGFQYVLQMTYRNLVIRVSYNGYDAHMRSILADEAIALITDKAAQELVRIRAYARSHTHDRWPIRVIAGRAVWTGS